MASGGPVLRPEPERRAGDDIFIHAKMRSILLAWGPCDTDTATDMRRDYRCNEENGMSKRVGHADTPAFAEYSATVSCIPTKEVQIEN